MNIYEKVLAARNDLRAMKLKKTGWNPYSKFEYFDLKDFLGPIMDLCAKYSLFTQVSYTAETATLTVFNIEKPEEKLIFASPMSTAKLTACHEVQNLGAVETYERRYLYMTAFEILEPDALDSTSGKDQQKPTQSKPQNEKKLTDKQLIRLFTIAGRKGYGKQSVEKGLMKRYEVSNLNELTKEQYDEICENYESLEDK